jgi:protein-S-isoprenylcysteine O-methyltransferase Ste14
VSPPEAAIFHPPAHQPRFRQLTIIIPKYSEGAETAMNKDPPQRETTAGRSLPDHANVVVPPPVLWVFLLAAGIGLDYVVPLPFMPAGFPSAWLGGGVWLAGFALAALAIGQFRRAGTEVQTHTSTAAIVDSGVFALSRNPIYLGAHIGTLGVAIGLDTLWILATLVPFHLIIRYGVVAREEAYLEGKFGVAYLAYKTRVRRWL